MPWRSSPCPGEIICETWVTTSHLIYVVAYEGSKWISCFRMSLITRPCSCSTGVYASKSTVPLFPSSTFSKAASITRLGKVTFIAGWSGGIFLALTDLSTTALRRVERQSIYSASLGHRSRRVLLRILVAVSYTHLTLPTNREV